MLTDGIARRIIYNNIYEWNVYLGILLRFSRIHTAVPGQFRFPKMFIFPNHLETVAIHVIDTKKNLKSTPVNCIIYLKVKSGQTADVLRIKLYPSTLHNKILHTFLLIIDAVTVCLLNNNDSRKLIATFLRRRLKETQDYSIWFRQ